MSYEAALQVVSFSSTPMKFFRVYNILNDAFIYFIVFGNTSTVGNGQLSRIYKLSRNDRYSLTIKLA